MKGSRMRLLFGAILVALVIAGVYFLSPRRVVHPPLPPAEKGPAAPAYTPEITKKLKVSNGFQALVSYTDRGFEPAIVNIKKGETVRFTNNSSGKPWVAATGEGGTIYPARNAECGQSNFDSCTLIDIGDFWEFTFELAGTWSYKNNADATKGGTVHVE